MFGEIFLNVAFIACEYNPFHNGHLYHLNETKKAGADAIICIMSGNFVQRGEAAVAEKHFRAKLALQNGADLVLELPLKFAVAPASLFADGFIKTAASTGLSGFISFGSKDLLDDLLTLSDYLFSDTAEAFAQKQLKNGINYPKAKNLYVEAKLGPKYAEMLSDANNTLALEYIRASRLYFKDVSYNCVLRNKVFHDSAFAVANVASAGFIREKLFDSYENNLNDFIHAIRNYVPDNVFCSLLEEYSSGRFPIQREKFEVAALSRLFTKTRNDIKAVNNVTEGLENRIFDVIKNSNLLSDVLDGVKSKRFTSARIRQIIMNLILGITRSDIENDLSYIRVLGFNSNGRKLLHTMKKSASLPVVSNLSEISSDNETAMRDAYLDFEAGKLYGLLLPENRFRNPEFDIPPVFVDE